MLAVGAMLYVILRKTVYWRGADLRPLPESDWVYRHGLQDIWRQVQDWAAETSGALTGGLKRWVLAIIGTAGRLGGPAGLLGKTVTPGAGVFWLTAMLGLYLLIFLA